MIKQEFSLSTLTFGYVSRKNCKLNAWLQQAVTFEQVICAVSVRK
jgi:hypothetical protein